MSKSNIPKFEDTYPVDDVVRFDETEPINLDEISEPNETQSFIRSVADIVTGSTIDEIQGGAAAGFRALGIDLPLSNKLSDIELKTPTLDSNILSKKYEDTLRAYRESTARGEDANPIASIAGTVGGALIPGSIAAKGIKTVGRGAGKLLGGAALKKGAGTQAIKQAIRSGRRLGTLGATAASGAAGGAAYGFGQGKEDFSSRIEEAKEGALFGAVAGAALPVAGGAVKGALAGGAGVVKSLLDRPLERGVKIFKAAKSGRTFSGDDALKRVNDDIRKFAEDFDVDFGKQIKTESELREEAIASAKAEGKIVNLKDRLSKLRESYESLPEATEQEIADKTDLFKLLDEYELGIDVAKETLKQKNISRRNTILNKLKEQNEIAAARGARKEARAITEEALSKKAALEEAASGVPVGDPITTATSEGIDVVQRPAGLENFLQRIINPEEVGPITMGTTPGGLPTAGFQQGARRIEKVLPEQIDYDQIPKTELDPEDALGLVRRMEELTQLGDRSLRTKAGTRAALEGKREVTDAVSEVVPEFGTQTQKISDLLTGFRELSGKRKGDLGPTYNQYIEKLKTMVRNAEDDASLVSNFDAVINKGWTDTRTGRTMLPLKDINPEMADSISSNFRRLAEENDLATAINNSLENTSSFMRLIGGIEAFGLKGAELAGTGVRKAGQAVKTQLDLSKDLMQLTPQQFQQLAQKTLELGSEAGKKLSNKLSAMATADSRRRHAIMFTILQNPQYRQLLSGSED